eukprot:CAMPEP_0197616720 /NCGR_PEP_ID=MMETSP1326-20131121/60672_1 /TAXON_ID=1155430 /ORGANISM="Genus nov. species nov., Strain RCC2288" /LENGTH=493 /DNA_ID=CAMNT_0043185607 /DNA_START=339 /DNA_END=1821 /DNA_ORIENTATION=+
MPASEFPPPSQAPLTLTSLITLSSLGRHLSEVLLVDLRHLFGPEQEQALSALRQAAPALQPVRCELVPQPLHPKHLQVSRARVILELDDRRDAFTGVAAAAAAGVAAAAAAADSALASFAAAALDLPLPPLAPPLAVANALSAAASAAAFTAAASAAMSYFVNNENAQPAARATGRGQSSNAYANGSDQNCGNVITDRSTVRLHAPPGGHSSICFGASDAGPAPSAPSGVRGQSREAAQNMAQHSASGVSSQIFGAPSGGRSGSSNAYANGQDQNNGNFITDRPTTRLHAPPGGFSSISFGGDANDAQQQSRPGTTAAAAKERETRGHDIFGTNNPGPAAPAQPRYAAQQQQQQQESYGAPEQSYEEDADGDAPAAMIEATDTNVKAMMIAELRIMCRDHGLSPAGSKPTLVNRICEAMAMGQVKVMVANRGTSGLSNTVNNYTRSEGQNVGNFMTDRNSSRVLAPPGGGSSFSFGYSDPPPAAHHNVVGQMR